MRAAGLLSLGCWLSLGAACSPPPPPPLPDAGPVEVPDAGPIERFLFTAGSTEVELFPGSTAEVLLHLVHQVPGEPVTLSVDASGLPAAVAARVDPLQLDDSGDVRLILDADAQLTEVGRRQVRVRADAPGGYFVEVDLQVVLEPRVRAFSFGGKRADRVRALAADAQGNLLVAGSFQDALELPSGAVPGRGSDDAFVAKFTPRGKLLWLQPIGGEGADIATALHVNADGAVWVAGSAGDAFWVGDTQLGSVRKPSCFLAKLEGATGQPSWARAATATPKPGDTPQCVVEALAVDGLGNAVVVGAAAGALALSTGPDLPAWSFVDGLVLAWSDSGAYLWGKRYGARFPFPVTVRSVAFAPDRTVWVAGGFTGTAVFDPSLPIYDAAVASQFAFQLNVSNGQLARGLTFGGPNPPLTLARYFDGLVTVGPAGAVYVLGTFIDTGVFGPTQLQGSVEPRGYLAKLTPAGGFEWARLVSPEPGTWPKEASWSAGALRVSGQRGGRPFLAHWTPDAPAWSEVPLPTEANSVAASVRTADGTWFVAGGFAGTLSADVPLQSRGGEDVFVVPLPESR